MYTDIRIFFDFQYSARTIYGQTIYCRVCNCFLLSLGQLARGCISLRVPRSNYLRPRTARGALADNEKLTHFDDCANIAAGRERRRGL